ncbi:MAG: hypothetical protein ACXAD7_27940 [Candidatus Kariarchaeaceae archaeon]
MRDTKPNLIAQAKYLLNIYGLGDEKDWKLVNLIEDWTQTIETYDHCFVSHLNISLT